MKRVLYAIIIFGHVPQQHAIVKAELLSKIPGLVVCVWNNIVYDVSRVFVVIEGMACQSPRPMPRIFSRMTFSRIPPSQQ
jgi:hypothetical protein